MFKYFDVPSLPSVITEQKCLGVRHVPIKAGLAQLEERSAFNRVVVGSIPTVGDFFAFLRGSIAVRVCASVSH